MHKRKPPLNRVGRRRGSSYVPQEPSKQEEDHSLLSWQGMFVARTQSRKNQGLFVYPSSLNFLFLSIKAFSFSCLLTMGADPKLQFSADPE